ncbi:biotin-dependent carboxyltransferase family protein [Bradyrhizobium sp. BWA-3-5]|uniref:5-oxoprolinase subunit C family protein n=1 Tax=Bradyrhizobium sp. BWA-3-5 TaxID=3080013 RepID=UPI00293EBF70|nr:biotin-dependent carboxyltransferase family protein [Bradyrhizobium sp. BWA-3-5]WOH63752.1 biotin-dependent carboxyltransferase family protein [Bradyrhizobium sp. BWA-3-5]
MIEVLKSSPFVTLQDLGRVGWRNIGIGTAGAMDWFALRTGNAILGNSPNAAGIEITASRFHLRFERDTAIAVTGADGRAKLSGLDLPPLWATNVKAGDELVTHPPRTGGMRTYLCIAGGIDTPSVLGSRSTDIKSGFGGYHGRSLLAGDRLPLGEGNPVRLPDGGFGAKPFLSTETAEGVTIFNVIPAAEAGLLTKQAIQTFWSTDWTVSPDNNRMGLRLTGPQLAFSEKLELLSHPILPGVIQVPPSGQPIIQAADANTCGGYPKAGVIVGAHVWQLGQLRTGARLRFRQTTQEAAVALTREIERYLERLARYAAMVCGKLPANSTRSDS